MLSGKNSFSVQQKKGKYIFFAESTDYAEEKAKLIVQYTKIVDPHAPIGKTKIKPCDTEFFCDNFSHYFILDKILPRVVRAIYAHRNFANCHGSARVAGGVFPFLEHCSADAYMKISDNIRYEELTVGDIIYLKWVDHSFVYLDQDICLSMNGSYKSLNFYSMREVLSGYKTSLKPFSISIYRKLKNMIYPELLINALQKYYEITRNNVTNVKCDQLTKILTGMAQAVIKMNSDQIICSSIKKESRRSFLKLLNEKQYPKFYHLIKNQELIFKISSKKYKFLLSREDNNKTLSIHYVKSEEKLYQLILTLNKLEKEFILWLKQNKLYNQVNINIIDEEKNKITMIIKCKSSIIVDKILQWLILITNVLNHPLQDQKIKYPGFFSNTNHRIIKNKNEFISQVARFFSNTSHRKMKDRNEFISQVECRIQ